jgi:abortive infection bacteriophage resistance protein
MAYNRPWMNFASQLALLKSRGMIVTDDTAAISYLERIGYYRLSAYWFPFRQYEMQKNPVTGKSAEVRTDNFVPNTQFVDAVELYLFDKKLRLLVVDALERIEVALRVDIAYLLGERDTFAHHDARQFHRGYALKQRRSGKTAHQEWLEKYDGLVTRSKEDFVKHYREKHGPRLPIWVAIEVWDFGAVSQLFAMMEVKDQTRIAAKYGVTDWRVFQSWLRALNYLRNLVAHHSRLWNRNIIDQPKLPARGTIAWCDGFIGKPELIAKPFLLLAIARHLLKCIGPNSLWDARLGEHLMTFPVLHSDQKRSISDMGLPADWQQWW